MPCSSDDFKICKRCGRKFLSKSGSAKYCSVKCRNTKLQIGLLSGELIKEIYLLINNEKLFSNEELGAKLRTKNMKERFEKVLFVKDKGE